MSGDREREGARGESPFCAEVEGEVLEQGGVLVDEGNTARSDLELDKIKTAELGSPCRGGPPLVALWLVLAGPRFECRVTES